MRRRWREGEKKVKRRWDLLLEDVNAGGALGPRIGPGRVEGDHSQAVYFHEIAALHYHIRIMSENRKSREGGGTGRKKGKGKGKGRGEPPFENSTKSIQITKNILKYYKMGIN